MNKLSRAGAVIGFFALALAGCASNRSASSSVVAPSRSGQLSFTSGSGPVAMDSQPSPPARAVSYADAEPVTGNQIARWSASGMREDIIIDRIERSPSVFHLTAADENSLRDKGVSESVIQEMKATAKR